MHKLDQSDLRLLSKKIVLSLALYYTQTRFIQMHFWGLQSSALDARAVVTASDVGC